MFIETNALLILVVTMQLHMMSNKWINNVF